MENLNSKLFFDPAHAKPNSAQHPNRRNIRGDGGTLLRVPGLKRLDVIGHITPRGDVQFDLSEKRRHMISGGEEPERETVTYPLFTLVDPGTLEARILRAVVSNDGVFQDGCTFWVEGEWNATVEAEAKTLGEADVARQTAQDIADRSNTPQAPRKGRRH